MELVSGIHPTAVVHAATRVGDGVVIGPYAVIEEDVVIGDDTVVGAHAMVGAHTRLGRGNQIHHGAVVGSTPQDLKFAGDVTYTIVGDRNTFREYCTVNRATSIDEETRLGSDNLLMAYSHVGHNCRLGNNVVLANSANLAGHVRVDDHAIIGGLTGVHQFVHVGAHAMIGGCSRVTQDVPTYALAAGSEPRIVGANAVGLSRRGFSQQEIREIRRAYKTIFRSKLTVAAALERLDAQEPHPIVLPLIDFIRKSSRGMMRAGR
ncbi:MAG: acyl-[acyl-carrier-protein]--UDP-N-acetylglucosamine O-acyltransferase [Gemmatimonadetes bacterium]|nr:acyl-[acyl-carrier-protein]--UDP-N-acetylglucosamine O-acyltransferase [Gemmatimonadota bacterium]